MSRLLSFHTPVTSEISQFLSKNIIGSPGRSLVYQQLRTTDKLLHIPNPTFVCLKKGKFLIATACFCQRENDKLTSFYIRYFSFAPVFRSVGSSRSIPRKNSKIKEDVEYVLGSKSPLIDGNRNTVFYAYVDPKNKRSSQLCSEFGFEKISSFSTLTFSRLWPKKHPQVELINESQKTEVRALLREQYAAYQFYTEENLFFENSYFVLKNQNGEIIAGVQATLEHWKIQSLAGRFGKLGITILSKIPLVNKLINKNHHFVAFDYLFNKTGHEASMEALFESVFSSLKVNSGLIALDSTSRIYCEFKSMKLGLLNSLKKEMRANVIAKKTTSNESTATELNVHPCFISTLDLT